MRTRNVDEALLHACDLNYQLSDAVFFGASLRGEVVESHALHLAHCGFPARDFNRIRLKHADDLAAALERGESYFRGLALPCHVELRAELAAACAPALRERGYEPIGETPGMVLAPIRAGAREVPGLEIEQVRSPEALALFQNAAFEGFGFPGQVGSLFLTPALLAMPDVALYLGRLDGEPVATSCLVRTPGVAGIYWVATLPPHRGRGLGEALTWAAVCGGAEASCPVASLQASAMGAPVYARMGFATPLRYLKYARPDAA